MSTEEVGSLNFETGHSVECATKDCLLQSSKEDGDREIRVLDTIGFSGGNVNDNVDLDNLKVARTIAGVSGTLVLDLY